ncbi:MULTISPECIES: aspartyl protease family protein [Hwangdonia]|uniref:Aspartyl protease family protein n=1 Tax=Hwangdonia seohaensis TaxID=1240727 RepID=A0ABW3RCP9_9FLAO|nr:aspartyl protease family protein [Hwangdonia seohaensis]
MKLATFLIALCFVIQKANTQKIEKNNDTGKMSFELIKEKIIIPVQIGNKTFRFLVDTGGIFEISEEVQNQFNFNQTKSITIVDINRKEVEIKSVTVPEIKLGNWSFKNRKAIVSDLHSKYPYSCFELDGMIGRDFFDKVILHFNYATKTFRLKENEKAVDVNKNNRTKLKLSHRGLPNLQLRLNGKKEYIEFDSGSGDFYSPKTSDVEKRLTKSNPNEALKFTGEFSFGVSMDDIKISNRYKEKVKSLQLGSTTFINFYSQFSKISAPRIGARILKYGAVTLDYKNGWFYFKPYKPNQNIEPFKTFGFDVAIQNRCYKVKWVLDNSEAYHLGMRSGDKILSINNVSTNNINEDCFGYLNGYSFKNKQRITVVFLNNQSVKKSIELEKIVFE